MKIIVTENPIELGKSAGRAAAQLIRMPLKKTVRLISSWLREPASLKR